jgi:hypothetical protein
VREGATVAFSIATPAFIDVSNAQFPGPVISSNSETAPGLRYPKTMPEVFLDHPILATCHKIMVEDVNVQGEVGFPNKDWLVIVEIPHVPLKIARNMRLYLSSAGTTSFCRASVFC